MKQLFFIAGFMTAGLFLEIGVSFANGAWKHLEVTDEHVMASTRVKNPSIKGSLEEQLINAAKNNNTEKLKALIKAGASLEARDNNDMTALMYAADKGYSNIARILIDAGADINAKNNYNLTAFFRAADKGHVEIVKMLITKGVVVNRVFKSLFIRAVHMRNTEMVKALIVEIVKLKQTTREKICKKALMFCNNNPELFDIITNALNKKEYQ